jgi:Ca-activated chloride channel family protein
MTLDPNDPRLTAFVLGELDPADCEEVESLLKESDEDRRAVDEIRLTVGWLTRELRLERESYSYKPLPNHQPLLADVPKSPVAAKSWWSRNGFKLGSLAAGLLLTSGLAYVALAPRGVLVGQPELASIPRHLEISGRRVADNEAPVVAFAAEPASAPAPKVILADGQRLGEAAPELLGMVELGRTSSLARSVRRRSVVEGSAAIEHGLALASAKPARAPEFYDHLAEGESLKLKVPEAPSAPEDAAKHAKSSDARPGMAGAAGMMNSRGLEQSQQQGSAPAAQYKMGGSRASAGGGMGGVERQAAAPSGAAASRGARAMVRSPGAIAPESSVVAATDGASTTRMGKTLAPAATKKADRPAVPSARDAQARSLSQSRAERALSFEPQPQLEPNTEIFFRSVREAPGAGFLIDVDRASYADVRRALSQNRLPRKDDVRIEELLNEFPSHDDAPSPANPDPFGLNVEIGGCPWDSGHRLARIGVAARPIDQRARRACRFVFLLDLSPPMQAPDRLPVFQWALHRLVDQLGERDRLAIVAFGPTPGVVLPSASCLAKAQIHRAVDELRVEVGGAPRSGLLRAYQIAGEQFMDEGTNRVVVVTDDASKIDAMPQDALLAFVGEKAGRGITMKLLALGSGTVDDSKKASLAEKGSGHQLHISSPLEAYRALVGEMGSKLGTVATDVKVQVELNAARVSAYRLLGYDPAGAPPVASIDDSQDAGAIVEGNRVSALYEIVPLDAFKLAKRADQQQPLDRRSQRLETLTVRLSFKRPGEGRLEVMQQFGFDAGTGFDRSSDDFKLFAAVAGFGLLLRQSAVPASLNYDLVQRLIDPYLADGRDPTGYYRDLAELVGKAKSVSGRGQRKE